MAQAASARPKINTELTQAAPGQAPRRPVGQGTRRHSRGAARVAEDARRSVRDPGRPVIEVAVGRTLPAPPVATAGESPLRVDPAEIPAAADIGKLGQALAAGRHGHRDELMANAAAYTGLRWGELTALTTGQIDTGARVITIDRKVIEVAGHLYLEAPKNRKRRQTIYPRLTPAGYPLAEKLAARIAPGVPPRPADGPS